MPTLIHGTTRKRAEAIIRFGPDPRYLEPGGVRANAGFSVYYDGGPYMFDPPEVYARGKDLQCPNEGGPVLLLLDVPEELLNAADPYEFFPPKHGLMQFDIGGGIEELLAAWHSIPKSIREI